VAGGANLQARARAARWSALQAAAASAGATLIATGHTADDRAETVLMRLLRGAGPRGLAVLAPRSTPDAGPPRLRPLIAARRRDVLVHLERHAVSYANDPSNRDLRFVRARIRHEILPTLEALSPELVLHLCALSDMLAELAPPDDPLAELGRAQRLAIGRALRLGRTKLTLRGEGGQRLDVTFPRGRPMVTKGG
jgi:tRNA(Ile)-lysidine synthase